VNVVYIDFDGTIVASNSLHYLYFIRWRYFLETRKLLALCMLAAAWLLLPLILLAHLISPQLRDRISYFLYRGLRAKDLSRLALQYWSQYEHQMLQRSLSYIKKMAGAGYQIVIVSGSVEQIVTTAVEYFDILHLIDHQITTKLEFCNGVATGRILGNSMIEDYKVTAICEFERSLPIDFRISVTDSYSDLPMLRLSDEKIVIRPNRRLMALAKREKWHVWSSVQ
jgi:phosphoserine phosphatase